MDRYPKSKTAIVGLLPALLFVAATLAAETSVSGIVYGDESNDYGDLISVVLVVNEDALEAEYYSIVMDSTGNQLLEELGSIVTVTGTTETREDGSKWIRVKTWIKNKGDE